MLVSAAVKPAGEAGSGIQYLSLFFCSHPELVSGSKNLLKRLNQATSTFAWPKNKVYFTIVSAKQN